MKLLDAQQRAFQRRRKTTIETQNAATQNTVICSSVGILLTDVVAKGVGVR